MFISFRGTSSLKELNCSWFNSILHLGTVGAAVLGAASNQMLNPPTSALYSSGVHRRSNNHTNLKREPEIIPVNDSPQLLNQSSSVAQNSIFDGVSTTNLETLFTAKPKPTFYTNHLETSTKPTVF